MSSATLNDVQYDVRTQILRDYGDRDQQSLEAMLFAGLAEEAGEVLGVLKRKYRHFEKDARGASEEHLIEELGDVLWYLAGVCFIEGIDMDKIYEDNKKKLEERYGK